MLTLQRASAGSGKTYTLTKRYITLLISTIDEGSGLRRLRTKGELADSVQHILAVTFTNKATNEMKERIVNKLFALAYPPYDEKEPDKKPDYMKDFVEEFHVDEEEISRVCREALHQVLYEYSDFNISTIDAFFQNILRTFAYESDLPDSYQVVIDEKYLMRMATESLLDDIVNGHADEEEKYWVKRLVERANSKGSTNWNVYQRREGRNNSAGAFNTLLNLAGTLDKFESNDVRMALERFAETGQSLRHSDAKIRELIDDRAAEFFAPMVSLAHRVNEEYGAYGNIKELLPNAPTNFKFITEVTKSDAIPTGAYKMKVGNSHISGNAKKLYKKNEMAHLKSLWDELGAAYEKWEAFVNSDDVRYWRILEDTLPDVALTVSLRRRMAEYLVDNDAMKLADTNSMIHRIIGDEDVPFIYERLGTRLNHFLIDEFQDTSKMQWENFSPLLRESESHGNANLIIGDAKQSIYRFRSAEPKLITETVPTEFKGQVDLRGFTEDENANWRSRPNVVKFNNFFFRSLSDKLGDKMSDLYSNTVQLPKKDTEGVDGYVEISYFDKSVLEPEIGTEVGDTDSPDDNAKVPAVVINRIGETISDMLRRGYRQKEIAVLVNSREGGKQVIAGLMAYDERERGDASDRLEFVSEDSLTLESSGAVTTVIESFRLIQENVENGGRSYLPELGEYGADKDAAGKESVNRRINWVDIQNHFRVFSAKNQDKDLTTRIREFFGKGDTDRRIEGILSGMQAVTLPSLVEELAKVFVSDESRVREAAFLAAFQDAVLDYCEANPTDIGSMLRWWEASGKNICISSPEDTNAINVMTIHKSKGLEFECVILPDIDLQLDLNKIKMWVDVPTTLSYSSLLPEMLPVTLSNKSVKDTVWQKVFEDERFLTQMDNLNKVYVAMTRAVSELYLFMKSPLKDGQINPRTKGNMRCHSYEICADSDALLEKYIDGSNSVMLPEVNAIVPVGENGVGFSYGNPIKNVEEALRKDREKKEREVEPLDIEDGYFINRDRELLKFHTEGTPFIFDEADDDRIDPRSEGSLKHAVLEMVKVEEDLPMALSKLRGRGLITRRMIQKYEPELKAALESVRERGWFDGSWKVMNERSMLYVKGPVKRPDRVMVSPEGDVIVVDYKFGDVPKEGLYGKQVAQYMGYLEEMHTFRSVKGFIWYVKLGEVVEVEQSVSFAESYADWQVEQEKKRLQRNAKKGNVKYGEKQFSTENGNAR